MHYYDEEDDREPLSWRDIDKLKDGGKHRDGEKPLGEEKPRRTSYAHKQYKKKLEEFFSTGKKKEDKVKNDELKKLKEIKNKNQYLRAADEYIARNGYPKDLDFLLSMLDHKDSEKILASVKVIEELFKDESDTRKDIIRQKIHILEMTSSDSKVQSIAEETLSRMKE